MVALLNYDCMRTFDRRQFVGNRPFPWYGFSRFLTSEAFAALDAEFPSLEFFERHSGMERLHSQRPHNRYYLAFTESIYGAHRPGEKGCVGPEHLSATWREFIRQLQTDETYLAFVRELLGVAKLEIRFAWHIAGPGDDISPHVDAESKAGTHFFYFHTSAEWQPEWGGGTVFLGGKRTESLNPEIEDFAERHVASILENRSVLFRNGRDAWHALTCSAVRKAGIVVCSTSSSSTPGPGPRGVPRSCGGCPIDSSPRRKRCSRDGRRNPDQRLPSPKDPPHLTTLGRRT